MIKTFACKETQGIFNGKASRKLPGDIQSRARLVLVQIDSATSVDQLRVPPSNRLKTLKGTRTPIWSVRINDQWRVIFRWDSGQAFDVEITDYH